MMLDTNALSALADDDELLVAALAAVPELYVPVVVLGEYRYGIGQSRYRRTYQAWLDEALGDLQVVPVMDSTAREYSRVLLELRRAGTPLPTNDAWIAALCREHRLALVSRDAHFDVVSGVRRIAW